jgi:hypothetical protein
MLTAFGIWESEVAPAFGEFRVQGNPKRRFELTIDHCHADTSESRRICFLIESSESLRREQDTGRFVAVEENACSVTVQAGRQ